MKNALITGGAGFIGSHLSDSLLERGYSVQVIDDLSTGNDQNIRHLEKNPRFSSIFDSVLNRGLMQELISKADVVFHLAAAVGVQLIVEHPVRTIETNIKATEVVLELCAPESTPVLLASTSEVYGKLQRPEFNEEDDLVLGSTSKSRWCYAASKIIDEFLAKAYMKERGLPTITVRLFNTIGPRQTGQYGMVVPRFVRQALSNDPMTVFGDGKQSRSFTWVGDVANAMIDLVEEPTAYGEVFNIGHTKEISIGDLARMVIEITRSASEVSHIPYEKAYEVGFEDMQRRLPDISKIKRYIGYQPSMDLPDMLTSIIAWERQQLEASMTT